MLMLYGWSWDVVVGGNCLVGCWFAILDIFAKIIIAFFIHLQIVKIRTATKVTKITKIRKLSSLLNRCRNI